MESNVFYDKSMDSFPILSISDVAAQFDLKACNYSIGPLSDGSISLTSSFNVGNIIVGYQGRALICMMNVIQSNFPFYSEVPLPVNYEHKR